MLETLERHLNIVWNLFYKDGSTSCMPCRTPSDRQPQQLSSKWPIVGCLSVLGHHVQNDGGLRSDWCLTRNVMWASFWANIGARTVRNLCPVTKAFLLYRAVVCLFLWKISRWPFQTSIAQELDATQCQMLAYILPCEPRLTETIDQFCRRRLRQARNVACQAGLWSLVWARRNIEWENHVLRGVDYGHFCCPLILFHNQHWLSMQRSIFVNSQNSLFAGRTGTRLNIGRPQTRWATGIDNANAAINARQTHTRGSNSFSVGTRLREAISQLRNIVFPQSNP